MDVHNTHDQRLQRYLAAVQQLQRGEFNLDLPVLAPGENDGLGQALNELARVLETQRRQAQELDSIITRVNAGVRLEDILDSIFQNFRGLIPYQRIGLALIEPGSGIVKSVWSKSNNPTAWLMPGYQAPLQGSSLQTVLDTCQPRILNDLEAYLAEKPNSPSTRLIIAEGMRASLTCPLITNGAAIGFLFFSSATPYAYADAHVQLFQSITAQLAATIEKGRLLSALAAREVEISRQNEALVRFNKARDTFVSMAAHDLRSPLSFIQTASDVLAEQETRMGPEETHKLAVSIGRQAQHMQALIADLLDFMQIETGNLKLELTEVNLQVFLDEVVYVQSRSAAPKGTRVLLAPVPAGYLVADQERLRQVLNNLISNAVKFSPPGSTVWVRAERVAASWRVAVQDEGPGILEEERGRLFQSFVRLSSRPTGGEKSTGLGLAVSRRLVEAHQGQIGVEPAGERGSVFWFTLPEGKGQ